MTFKSFVKKFKSEVRTIKIGHSQVLDILRHSGSDLLYCLSSAILDSTVGCIVDNLSPFFSIISRSDSARQMDNVTLSIQFIFGPPHALDPGVVLSK